MGFDISQLQAADTAIFELKDIDNVEPQAGEDGTPMKVEVYGPGAPQSVAADRKLKLGLAQRAQRQQRSGVREQDILDMARMQAQYLADRTKCFINAGDLAPLEVYLDPKCFHITKQVDEYLGRTENFKKGPPTG